MNDTNPQLHIAGVLRALVNYELQYRVIDARSPEDKDLTDWTERALKFEFCQIDWSQTPSHECLEWDALDDLVPAFYKLLRTLDPGGRVVVMWANGLCPLLEMSLKDVRKIATEIFEQHETSRDVFVFSRSEGWLIEMHHEGTICLGRSVMQ
jgi:hypothetical protein